MKTVSLITGASSGIGLYLAHEFAGHRHNVVLVAPDEWELNTLANQFRSQHQVEVHTIAADLEEPGSFERIQSYLAEHGLTVDHLVNNAGHGRRGKSWEIPIEEDLSMIRLNIEAVLRLTKLLLPPMIDRKNGRILNTASIAGFEPGPLLNVYHSTKAFILSWSEALAIELEGTGVTVTALCPGPTDTDFFPKAGMENVRGFQQAKVMAPQDVAAAGYEGMMQEKLFVVPGTVNKALVMSRRLLSEEAQARLNLKFYEESPPEKRTRMRGDFEKAAAT
ncbi:MAG: short-chain dehydrogenase/reductase [Verrucomicrobiales bacterium]|nr:short-chain dehydrogenase/reductase [Verrucomicrobiales bacterium]